MKASKFSDAQKAFILKQGTDGMPVADVCRKAGISQATYFNWKKKYDGLLPTEMRRLKQLEDENSKLKRIVADLSLDKEMLQDAIRRSGSASWSTRCEVSGTFRSEEHVRCSKSIRPPTITSLAAPDRPISNSGLGKFARRACAMAIGASMSCSDAKVVFMGKTKPDASIAS